MSVNRTSLGKRISFYRSKSNLTQEVLAAKVNCSREYIHPFFFERESKIPLAAFYLFEVPILIGIHKAILEYSFSKNFKKQKSRNRMNYLQAHYCTAFAHSVPAYITYCYGIALTNRYYIVDPKERLVELVG